MDIKIHADTAIEAFRKNEREKKVFWVLFVMMAGLVLTQVVDPGTAKQIMGMIAGMEG